MTSPIDQSSAMEFPDLVPPYNSRSRGTMIDADVKFSRLALSGWLSCCLGYSRIRYGSADVSEGSLYAQVPINGFFFFGVIYTQTHCNRNTRKEISLEEEKSFPRSKTAISRQGKKNTFLSHPRRIHPPRVCFRHRPLS